MPWEQRGRIYRALRKARGLNQREVGELLGVEQGWISQIEKGRKIPPGWTEEEEIRVYEEEPSRWDEQPVDRTLWDSALALGGAAKGESAPFYTIGLEAAEDALPLMPEPLVAVRDRDAADSVAALLAEGGVAGVAVVPLWLNWLEERGGTVLDGADDLWQAVRRLHREPGGEADISA